MTEDLPPDGAAEQADGAAEQAAAPDHTDRHKRLHLTIALSIAVVSVLGALVSWRAEVHASAASELDQNAVAATINATNQAAQAQTLAASAQSEYERYARLGDEAARLDPRGCGETHASSISGVEADVACSVQVVFSEYNDPGYINANGTFNVEKYAADVVAADRYGVDANPAHYQKAAAQDRNLEDTLLYLSIGLVVALALFTLGRLAKERRRILALAVPGWLALGGALALFAAMEL
ncbi:MAG TPA: hypothetical protein VG184_10885 [Acidimicrobiales bacterium]|jgi:hypothetical protein|nr:hypothetical protein [Acidimicrobiales bacterium]